MGTVLAWIVGGAIVAAIVVGIYALFALALMWAWSISVVPLFHWPALTFWPAIGLLLICSLLFGGAKQASK